MESNSYCGVVREYHDLEEKKLKSEVFVVNGKKEGPYKSYHENGQLRVEVNYIDGLEQGIKKSYHYNGQLMREVNFIDGKEFK